MTGFDIALIVVLIGFALLGLKHGSVWIVSCLVGGFIGAFLVEYYQLPVAEMMGNFAGAKWISAVLLFLVGVLLAVIPGWIVSRMAGLFCMGAFDKILGVFAGLFAGLIAITLAFMIALPRFPSMERSASWQKSRWMRPFCDHLENFFGHPSKYRATLTQQFTEGVADQVTPIVNKTADSIKETAHDVEHTVSKKATAVKKAVTGAK